MKVPFRELCIAPYNRVLYKEKHYIVSAQLREEFKDQGEEEANLTYKKVSRGKNFRAEI